MPKSKAFFLSITPAYFILPRFIDCRSLMECIGRGVVVVDDGAAGLLGEDVPLPSVDLIDDGLALELVSADLGQDDGPDDPVDTTGKEEAEADNDVDPVREGFVDGVAIGVGNHGGDDKVDVAGEEEEDDGEGGGEGRVPVPRLAVEVEVDEAAGDENVDDGQGVGDDAGKRLA